MTYGNYPDLSGVKKILVVKLRQLGDVLLTTPVFTVLKNQFPEAQIDAYIYSDSISLLKNHPSIHSLITYNRGWRSLPFFPKLYNEWRVWKKIRREGYDLVINLTEGDRGAVAALISGAKVRVGFPPKGKWQKKFYTHIAKQCPGLRHTVERNLDPLRKIGIFPNLEDRELFAHVSEESLLSMKKEVGEGSFTLIHPTSRWRFKCWPVEKMRELTKRLIQNGERVVFTSGPDFFERDDQ